MKRISVFCGSSAGNKPVYIEAAKNLADTLIKNNLTLVYGGGKIGLMGILADQMLEQNGEVIGIIPHFLFEKEVGHHGLTELIKVNSMHERKALIQEKSDGFIALPGGFGTIEEIFEMMKEKVSNLENQYSKVRALFMVAEELAVIIKG